MSWVGKLGGRKVVKVNVVSLWVWVMMLFGEHSQAGLIGGINHTHWAIIRFSVDGKSGLDSIGPFQGGGGGCCYLSPLRWHPGMTVRVDWETGLSGSKGFPGFENSSKFLIWKKSIDSQRRHHSKEVLVANYTDQKQCGITVHFLPCDKLVVTTVCDRYGSPKYPINLPLRLPEPKFCPK